MSDCIFCRISRGELETHFLYEDEDMIAFRDINPKSKTHILVVPRRHIDSIMELEESDERLMGKLVLTGKTVAEDLGLKGYKMKINVGADGGQEVFHIHMHLMSNF